MDPKDHPIGYRYFDLCRVNDTGEGGDGEAGGGGDSTAGADTAKTTPTQAAASSQDNQSLADQLKDAWGDDTGDEGTAGEDTGNQPGDDADADEQGDDEPTPITQAVAAARRADAMRMAIRENLEGEFSTIEEVEAALETRAAEAAEAERDQQVGRDYTASVNKIVNNLRGFKFEAHDIDGNAVELTMSDQQINELVLNEFNGFRSNVRTAEREANFEELADLAVSMIPDDKYDEWAGKVSKGLAIREWMGETAEYIAPQTKAWRLREVSHEEALATAEQKGWDKAIERPRGQAAQGKGAGSASVTSDGKNEIEMAGLIQSGKLDVKSELRRLIASS